jgi:DHA1 family bicyclomycin/chloramphenicol resistance-like MFS transporter
VARRRLALVTVLHAGFAAFGPLSMDLYLPASPHLATDLRTSAAGVQLTLTADVVGLVVGQLVAGPLSDAWAGTGCWSAPPWCAPSGRSCARWRPRPRP